MQSGEAGVCTAPGRFQVLGRISTRLWVPQIITIFAIKKCPQFLLTSFAWGMVKTKVAHIETRIGF